MEGESMNSISSYKKRNIMFLFFILLLVFGNHLYYQFFSAFIGVWFIIAAELLLVALWILLIRKRLLEAQKGFAEAIKGSSFPTDYAAKLSKSVSPDIFSTDMITRLVSYQNSQEKKQQALLEKLSNNNILLERNSKITDSIMHITSKVLSSGEIDEVLQSILDKAIELIPNAQKGSILIYNGSHLEFRASHGYDFEVLKHLKFNLEEIFQYDSEDFYKPCIINNPENFNKERLEGDKFNMLREGRGFELKSILSCAIQVDNDFYGIINLDNTEDKHAFSKEDKPLIQHLATQIGIALKNARLIEKILYLSRHDSLTGIYNRCYFEELLMRIFQLYKTSKDVFSLAILDINDLKKINDTYGHEAGDLLLRRFVQIMKECLTKDDIFARYGGDEFAIIFTDKNRTQVEEAIKNAKSNFADAPLTYCGKEIAVISFECGVTEFPAETSEYEELVKLADAMMYKDKRKRKKPIR
jgi:c-di-GMP phosphodiesterase